GESEVGRDAGADAGDQHAASHLREEFPTIAPVHGRSPTRGRGRRPVPAHAAPPGNRAGIRLFRVPRGTTGHKGKGARPGALVNVECGATEEIGRRWPIGCHAHGFAWAW